MRTPFLLLLLAWFNAHAQQLPHTQKLYANIDLETKKPRSIGGMVLETERKLITGTCWVVEVKGQPALVTAAHNLGLGPNFQPALAAKAKLLAVLVDPIIGVLAGKVEGVGAPPGNPDWVLLRPVDTSVLKGSQLHTLGKTAPKAGDTVTVIGFPDTAHEQRTTRTVTAVSLNNEFVVFNEPLEPGYSGGVVLNAKDQAIGVVVTTDKKQSTALLMNADSFSDLTWKPFEQVRHRRVEP